MKHNKTRIKEEGHSQARIEWKNKECTHKVPNVSKSEGGVGERRTDDKEKSGYLMEGRLLGGYGNT